MIIGWSLCQCCGQSAKQRQIWTRKYHANSGQFVELNKPHPLYPDLCDHCLQDITSRFTGDDVWLEIERRESQFKKDFRVVGFEPIIEANAAALSYSI